jgi:Family of unknown function (DUF6624)
VTRDERLREELLVLATRPDDPASADRLWTVLDDLEAWPGVGLVGEDGAHAAWLIAQLSDSGLQRRALEHLEVAVDCGDAPAAHYACLLDRVRMAGGRPQVYGTQIVESDDGELAPWPVEDPDHVDDRRARVGLVPLVEHTAMIRARRPRRA